MKENYDKAFTILCQLEGYTSNIKGDPGGFTIWGITEKWFPEAIKSMKNMSSVASKKYAYEFYRTKFWNALNCDALAYPLDIIAFCQGVNAQVAARKFLAETNDWREFLFKFQTYYTCIVNDSADKAKFFRGWINRTLKLWTKFSKGELI